MSESVNGISPTGRTKVTLGDIATNISENEYKPEEKGLDRCVGLEHLDPGSLKICRWSPITPEMSFTRRFCKGQILFGKRRAYQKKVALADFDGICSSDILVIDAKKGNFVSELLPFIIQDDRFFEYAVGTSSGSLSPRTKWKFLADYEISLPSLNDQRRLLTTLLAAEDCIVNGEHFVAVAEQAKHVLLRELISNGIDHNEFKNVSGYGKIPKEWKIKSTKETLYLKGRIGWKGLKKSEFLKSGPFLITGMHFLDNGRIDWDNCFHISTDRYDESPEIQVKQNDILLTKDGTIGKIAFIDNLPGPASLNSHLLVIRPLSEEVSPQYLYRILESDLFTKFAVSNNSGSTLAGLSQSNFEKFCYPIPPLPEQHQIAGILARCDETIAAARANTMAAKALKMKLINEMLMT